MSKEEFNNELKKLEDLLVKNGYKVQFKMPVEIWATLDCTISCNISIPLFDSESK